jgi:hypothetical protein
MFYAANIPLLESSIERKSKFAAGLKFHMENGRRAHLLYGDYEHNTLRPPMILPPLQNSFFEKYHPMKGNLTVKEDNITIERLVDELLPYMEFVEEGYVGEKNENGEKHGHGVFKYASGDIYDHWKKLIHKIYTFNTFCTQNVHAILKVCKICVNSLAN